MKKPKKQITFQEAYPAPFSECCGYIEPNNGGMALNLLYDDMHQDDIDKIVAILNNECTERLTHAVTYNRKEGTIDIDGKPAFLVRGWGHLTGCGALNLPNEEAARIQDEFAEWVCRQLTTKNIEYAYQ